MGPSVPSPLSQEPQPLPSPSIMTTSTTSTATMPSSASAVLEELLDSLVGNWKLQKSENFDNYLKAQGVGCVARALVGFLDFSISIVKKRNGLRVQRWVFWCLCKCMGASFCVCL